MQTTAATNRGDDSSTTNDRPADRRGDDAKITSDERRTEEGTRNQTEQATREAKARDGIEVSGAATRRRSIEGQRQQGRPEGDEREDMQSYSGQKTSKVD